MKSASRVMYIIGKVFNIIEMVLTPFIVVLGALCIAYKSEVFNKLVEEHLTTLTSAEQVKYLGISLIIFGVVSFIISIVVFLLAKKASRSLENGDKSTTPHVIMLIIGIFGDVFYFLAGLFCVLSINETIQEQKQE